MEERWIICDERIVTSQELYRFNHLIALFEVDLYELSHYMRGLMMHWTKKRRITVINHVLISVFTISIMCFPVQNCEADGTTTLISINPEISWISPGNSFEVNVFCTPGQPVKSYELKLSFDPSLIKVNAVTIGTLFDGFQTYYSNGDIDNVNGNVTNIFCLILGEGNVTNSGTLISISCSSLGIPGDCILRIFDAGVTNETGYLPISVSNGQVVVQNNISISNPIPLDRATNQDKELSKVSIKIQHQHGEKFDYYISTNPSIGNSSGLDQTNGTKECLLSDLSYNTTYHWYVSVKETSTGIWTNHSYRFTTEIKPRSGGSSSGGGGGSEGGGSSAIEEVNLAPIQPIIPFGPHFIESGIPYSYSSHTYDPNGDMIRYRFKWGDGNISNWTEFKQGNESVSLNYSWKMPCNCTIQILAQDEKGLNSSWSDALHIITIHNQNDTKNQGYFNPVANFSYITNESNGNVITFNASTSFYYEGIIEKYYWDFGDDTLGTGIIANHTYTTEGLYNVTLVVKETEGKVDSKTIRLYAEASSNNQSVDQQGLNSLLWYIICTGLLGGAVVIVILFKTRIITTLSKPKTMHIKKSYLRELFTYRRKGGTKLHRIIQGIKILYHQQRIINVLRARKDKRSLTKIPQSVTMDTDHTPDLNITFEKGTEMKPRSYYEVLRKGLATYWEKAVTNLRSIGKGIKALYQQRIIDVLRARKDRRSLTKIPQSFTIDTDHTPDLNITFEKGIEVNPINQYEVLQNRIDELFSLRTNNNEFFQELQSRANETSPLENIRNKIDKLPIHEKRY